MLRLPRDQMIINSMVVSATTALTYSLVGGVLPWLQTIIGRMTDRLYSGGDMDGTSCVKKGNELKAYSNNKASCVNYLQGFLTHASCNSMAAN